MWCHNFLTGTSLLPPAKATHLYPSASQCVHKELPQSQSCQAVKMREGKVQGVSAAHQGRMMLPSSFCRWLGQHPDLLISGALDPSGFWGFGLPTADDFSLMLNSSAGKSTPEPPTRCNSSRAQQSTDRSGWAAAPCSKQQHSAHIAQLQICQDSAAATASLSLLLVLLQWKTPHMHSGKHGHGQILWFPAKPLLYFKELKMTKPYLQEYKQRSGAKEERGSKNHICFPKTGQVFLTVPKKHIRGGTREWRTRHKLI